jgi:hypothetical protein
MPSYVGFSWVPNLNFQSSEKTDSGLSDSRGGSAQTSINKAVSPQHARDEKKLAPPLLTHTHLVGRQAAHADGQALGQLSCGGLTGSQLITGGCQLITCVGQLLSLLTSAAAAAAAAAAATAQHRYDLTTSYFIRARARARIACNYVQMCLHASSSSARRSQWRCIMPVPHISRTPPTYLPVLLLPA